jgi:hypothetical protein
MYMYMYMTLYMYYSVSEREERVQEAKFPPVIQPPIKSIYMYMYCTTYHGLPNKENKQ